MTFVRPFAALCALALLAPLAHAQEFPGRFSITGKDSLSRDVSATVRITASGSALSVDREGKVQTASGPVALRWRSSSARLASPRVLRVTYKVAVPGAAGLVTSLDPETATAAATLAVLERENVLEAVYFLSADGRTLREVISNTTRFGPERWRSLEARGQRVTTAVTAITAAELQARVERHVRDWYTRYTNTTYVSLTAAATTAAERARLAAARTRDLDFAATCELTEGDDDWSERTDDLYAAGNGYRDANGAVVPRAKVRIFALSFMPEHAGIGLSKAFVFDGRTGAVLEEGDVQD